MATRIIAIPDANGLIRIACGGDILEIEVQAASQPAPSSHRPRCAGSDKAEKRP